MNFLNNLVAPVVTLGLISFSLNCFADQAEPGMKIDPERTAIVITDPQNDFLSPTGVTWGVVGESVEKKYSSEP
ncbi:hypothetical protein ACJJIG_20525 [Microbulbifer sp. SSSA007]|uniref:hypothetical protein n=1 Tax=unclassified Microbulbifer TaxID=2619833 RepID=UPI00403A6F08